MVNNIYKTLSLTGASGRIYIFNLYAFNSFDDLRGAFKSMPAIYVFAKLTANDQLQLIYLGETQDLSQRFNEHHKESCITWHGADCIGIYVIMGEESYRIEAEIDLLNAFSFPCNDTNN